jgi:hypothetical protein
MARSRQERLPEARDMCVGSTVFGTTRLNMDISLYVPASFIFIHTAPEVVPCIKSPSSREEAGSWETSPGDLPR